MDNYKPTRNSKRFHGLLRVAIIFAIALLAAGGALGGQEDAGTRKIGHVLMLVGYGLFAALLVALTGAALWFWRKKAALIQSSPKVCEYTLYLCLAVH